jgi:hypothetical protein
VTRVFGLQLSRQDNQLQSALCVAACSSASSASVLRRAEAAAARRQQLLHRLHRLTGTQPSSAAAAGNPLGPGAGSGSVKAGSVCGSTGSRMSLGNYSSLAAAAGEVGLAR